ncbi:MAG: pyruvate, phosphate dikinase [Ilumatobacteraceae bacterium]
MSYVYAFDHKHRRPPKELKDLLGGKGANLAEMTSVLKLPVPPGFTISTDACRAYMHGGWPTGLDDEIAAHVAKLEKAMGRRLGDAADPLLVSVRSGAKFSMPGMMDTVLNLGLNDKSVKGLANVTGDARFAYDSYRRFISMYGRIVLGIDGERFEHPLEKAKDEAGVKTDAELTAAQLQELCDLYKTVVKTATGKPFPQAPDKQLRGAVEAVFKSWNGARAIAYRVRERIDHNLGTAVNVQTMVFGNRDDNSGTGVGFTRNAATGENKPYGDFLINAQGEDVVAGIRNTEDLDALGRHFPAIHDELLGIFARLEKHYEDMCDTEFTIEQGKLWMLQTRVGKRTGTAALRMAVEMTKGTGRGADRWKISKDEALMRITADHLDQVLHPQFAGTGEVIAKGLAASPGAAVGRVYFTAEDAADAAERGEDVVLVRNETSPEDVHGMMASKGILTARGGLVSHAAVVARGWGTPAVVGAESVKIDGRQFSVGNYVVREGEVISLDGSSGAVYLGEMHLTAAEPSPEFNTVLQWADAIRKGKLGVRANADTGEDAKNARDLGAEGIGLCRTEHMFLAPDRLPVVREMILARTPDQEEAALGELGRVQQIDFEEILDAMDGLPVTVRLLDPPLHEFLPSVEELRVKQAGPGGLSAREEVELAAAESWAEHNPMIGTRGVRLGVVKPGLYAMQVRALMAAAAELRKKGKNPIVEVMIPLTVTREEMHTAAAGCRRRSTRRSRGCARSRRSPSAR